MRVLVVEDQADIRDTLRDALEDEGYVVAVASNGATALDQLFRWTEPCVVVLDLIMPTMSGLELLTAMGCDGRLASIPVIAVTSDPSWPRRA